MAEASSTISMFCMCLFIAVSNLVGLSTRKGFAPSRLPLMLLGREVRAAGTAVSPIACCVGSVPCREVTETSEVFLQKGAF